MWFLIPPKPVSKTQVILEFENETLTYNIDCNTFDEFITRNRLKKVIINKTNCANQKPVFEKEDIKLNIWSYDGSGNPQISWSQNSVNNRFSDYSSSPLNKYNDWELILSAPLSSVPVYTSIDVFPAKAYRIRIM